MNTILYDICKKRWVHPEKTCKFGSSIVSIAAPAHTIPFSVQSNAGKLGPLVGILTSCNKGGNICGDWKRFEAIQMELGKRGGISFVFSPDLVKETVMDGYVFKDNWIKLTFPYPDVIYNRIPYRTHEKGEACQNALALFAKHSIPTFNPCFFSKWDIHQALYRNQQLHRFLLPTILLDCSKRLIELLESYECLFVKHCESSRGKYVFQIKMEQKDLIVTYPNGNTQHMSVEEAWELISGRNQKFLAQPALVHDTIDGKKYDLRILVHYLSGSFSITGIGVRVASSEHIVTHVHHGGKIITSNELPRKVEHEVLKEMVQQCGRSLCTAFGRVREFSIDIGVDINGNYYIYECNAKPMTFDEVDIQTKAIKNIVTVFEQEAGFQ